MNSQLGSRRWSATHVGFTDREWRVFRARPPLLVQPSRKALVSDERGPGLQIGVARGGTEQQTPMVNLDELEQTTAVAACYDHRIHRVVIRLSMGLDVAFKPHDAPGLEAATAVGDG